ncbi:hypothetical protein NJC38_10975 [Pseudomonas sp. 21LCFQ010]|uniref:hypothetical protein n=1 Tax=Pseudomonas sp. 21LCFQ010 TaxID=2957506 RepID=UPI002097C010|nr:hypothetical protein [Pseudomonas sp. 21LCFQ010]MCO8162690.1 hypothetical protein [Pseudomonas sp. 21LCFQ010]
MSYFGEPLEICRAVPFNWGDTWLVVVSGDGPNFCGHALLRVGFYYFHILGWAERPWYMTEQGFERYKHEGGKRELFRRKIIITKPLEAQRKLEALSVKPWHWLGVPNNCVSYVEDILRAGGANDASFINCPANWR